MTSFDAMARQFRETATTWPPRDEAIAELLRQVAAEAFREAAEVAYGGPCSESADRLVEGLNAVRKEIAKAIEARGKERGNE